MPFLSFDFFLPVRILFGRGRLALLPEEARRLSAKKALLVTGRLSARAAGLLSVLPAHLRRAGVESVIFDRVFPDPDTGIVDEGIRLAREKDCDLVIGIGGGSALDCAKAVAGLCRETGFRGSADYLEVDGSRAVSRPGLPFIAVPTLSGTGAEVTRNAVLVNRARGTKRSIRHDLLYPRLALVDPELTLTAPAPAAVSSGVDAFSHLFEGLSSSRSNALIAPLAAESLGRLKVSLVRSLRRPAHLSYREDIAFASLLGGMVISNGGLTLSHAVGSVIGPRFGIPHGIACCLTLPETAAFNLPAIDSRRTKLLKAALADDIPGFLRSFLRRLRLDCRLSEFGVAAQDLEGIAKDALGTSSARGNPRPCGVRELVKLLMKRL